MFINSRLNFLVVPLLCAAAVAAQQVAHPYVDLPLAQLVEHIPELKALQPVADQQELPMILQQMGQRIDDFLHNISDLIARENLTRQQVGHAAVHGHEPSLGSERRRMNRYAKNFSATYGSCSATTRPMLHKMCEKVWTLPAGAFASGSEARPPDAGTAREVGEVRTCSVGLSCWGP